MIDFWSHERVDFGSTFVRFGIFMKFDDFRVNENGKKRNYSFARAFSSTLLAI